MPNKRTATASIETLMTIALAAVVLLAVLRFANDDLVPNMKSKVASILSPGYAGSTGSIGFEDPGNTQIPKPDGESSGSLDDGRVDSVGDAVVKDFILEAIKQKAEDIAELAVEEAEKELENYVRPRLPMGLDLELEDWELEKAKLNQSLVKSIGTVVGAINAVDGLSQADQKVKDLANEGKYREAFGTIFSGSSRFITDAILSSKVVDEALDKLPSAVQVAIQSTIPNAIESATQAAGERVFDSVGKKINDQLWDWYDGGYLPRAPRIPRDFNFGSGS